MASGHDPRRQLSSGQPERDHFARTAAVSSSCSPLRHQPRSTRLRDAEGMEVLVHKLSQQSLLPDSPSPSISEEADQENLSDFSSNSKPSQRSTPLPVTASAASPMQLDSSQSVRASMSTTGGEHQLQQRSSLPQLREGHAVAPSEEHVPTEKALNAVRPKWQPELRLRNKSSSNLRTLTLMTEMVERNIQCNVQGSAPATPVSTLPMPDENTYIEPDDQPDRDFFGRPMDLEIDIGYCEQDDETLLSDTLGLRHASTPAGIRKFGFLRYRSSAEAAQQCKNMKRSVPRMRRRRKTNASSSTSAAPSPLPASVAT
ncbi:hypothetical protein F5Y15DRAFT_11083 [Xylariaceae sp. FL0016]|nr:hypothetical protein F5Y15DRAFT_11083 [Xylariaceae sp. FL0016]